MVSSTMSFQRSPRSRILTTLGLDSSVLFLPPLEIKRTPAPTYNGQVDQAHILFFLRQVSE